MENTLALSIESAEDFLMKIGHAQGSISKIKVAHTCLHIFSFLNCWMRKIRMFLKKTARIDSSLLQEEKYSAGTGYAHVTKKLKTWEINKLVSAKSRFIVEISMSYFYF